MAGEREGGFIKLHRQIESWPLWRAMPVGQRMVWVQLLLCANWKTDVLWFGSEKVTVERGTLAHAETEIARRAGVGRQVVRDAITKLLREGAITRQKSLPGNHAPWLITIVNYERFQGFDENDNPRSPQEGTKEEPSGNQGGTPREEREEGKKETLRLAPQAAPEEKPRAKPDPDRRALSDALVAAFLAARGAKYGFDRARDPDALSRLLGWSRDIQDHARRFRAALNAPAGDYSFRVDTIAGFATGRVWNHFAPVGGRPADGPAMLAPLGQR